MTDGILWCPHCSKPHLLGVSFCAETGKKIDQRVHRFSRVVTPANPLIGTTLDGRYRIRKRLGSGGRGVVFEAEQLRGGPEVAVKLVLGKATPETIARFHREAQVVARLHHPNVCRILDTGTTSDGTPYLVLERLVGETLADRLRRKRRLAPGMAVAMITQVLAALQAAHDAGILHRDVKPQNVFLVEGNNVVPKVKLLDFGFAKDVTVNPENQITRPGYACGTPQYMSPEQARVEELDPRSDLFSTGIVLYEALTGVHPFAAGSVLEMSMKILREGHDSVLSRRPKVPLSLSHVVDRSLAKDPRDRFESAAEMQAALVASLVDDEPMSEPTSTLDMRLPQLASSSPSSSAPS